MRTRKTLLTLFIIALLSMGNRAMAQTFQFDLSASFDGVHAWCLERPISGSYVYHFTYHINNKTGYIDRIHWNVKHSDIWDSETGEHYKVIDTGNDNFGLWWDFFNNIIAYTGMPYNVENGWLNVPEVLPEEGIFVNMAFKFIAHGEVYYLSSMGKVNVNANGDMVVSFFTDRMDCNY